MATDVASKGLDFPDIQHVINFDMPDEIENYVRAPAQCQPCRGCHADPLQPARPAVRVCKPPRFPGDELGSPAHIHINTCRTTA